MSADTTGHSGKIGEALENSVVLFPGGGRRPREDFAASPAPQGEGTAVDHGAAAGGSYGPPDDGAPPSGPPDDLPPDTGDSGGDGGGNRDFIVEGMNREWALVLAGSKSVILRENEVAPAEERVRMISLDAFKAYYQNSQVWWWGQVLNKETGEMEEKKVYRQRAPFWLAHPARRTYDGICFFPNPDGVTAPENYFNLWRGFSVTPDRSGATGERAGKYAIFLDHLKTNICNGDEGHFRWIWGWMAQMLQRPRQRLGTAIIMRGSMGSGKSKIGEVLGRLIESHYFQVDEPRYIFGQFNAHLAHCLLLQVDEGFWAGDKSAEGRLKGLVTSRKQMIEHKGVDPIRVDNFVRLIFTSNENWVVPAGLEERRFAVFDVADHVKQNIAYFSAMDEELDAGGYAALLADLLDFDLDAPDAPNVRQIPKTRALLEQKLHSMGPVETWWYGRLVQGAPTHRASDWPGHVPISTLYNDYTRTADRMGVRRKQSETEFGLTMRRLVPGVQRRRRLERIEITGNDGRPEEVFRRVWCYDLPSLDDCRAIITAMVGQDIEWPVEADEEDSAGGAGPQGEAGAQWEEPDV